MIEYGLILALVFVVMMVAVHAFAIQVVGTMTNVKDRVVNASDV